MSGATSLRPLFLVCEDGTEYLERFERFLGRDFRFLRAQGLGGLRALLSGEGAGSVGLLLDLDFRRTPQEELVDESGSVPAAPSAGERARLGALQGILILRALRRGGVVLPALLFADLDDSAQRTAVERDLSPLAVVPSSEGLPQLLSRLRALIR